jgi:hypothetical protein
MTYEYDAFAVDYHWLVDDAILSGDSFPARHRSLLASHSAGAHILDCACGIGSTAIGLARQGYQVTAASSRYGYVALGLVALQREAQSRRAVRGAWQQ